MIDQPEALVAVRDEEALFALAVEVGSGGSLRSGLHYTHQPPSLPEALVDAAHEDLALVTDEAEALVAVRDEEALFALAVEAVDLALLLEQARPEDLAVCRVEHDDRPLLGSDEHALLRLFHEVDGLARVCLPEDLAGSQVQGRDVAPAAGVRLVPLHETNLCRND